MTGIFSIISIRTRGTSASCQSPLALILHGTCLTLYEEDTSNPQHAAEHGCSCSTKWHCQRLKLSAANVDDRRDEQSEKPFLVDAMKVPADGVSTTASALPKLKGRLGVPHLGPTGLL